MVEQRFHKSEVTGPNPVASTANFRRTEFKFGHKRDVTGPNPIVGTRTKDCLSLLYSKVASFRKLNISDMS